MATSGSHPRLAENFKFIGPVIGPLDKKAAHHDQHTELVGQRLQNSLVLGETCFGTAARVTVWLRGVACHMITTAMIVIMIMFSIVMTIATTVLLLFIVGILMIIALVVDIASIMIVVFGMEAIIASVIVTICVLLLLLLMPVFLLCASSRLFPL